MRTRVATASKPVTDHVIGGAALVLASTVAISSALHPEGSYPAIATLFLTVPATLLFGSSATYGYLARSHCGRMREDHREQTARH